MHCLLRIHKLIILLVQVLATPRHASGEAQEHYEESSVRIAGTGLPRLEPTVSQIQPNALLPSALDGGGSDQLHAPAALPTGKSNRYQMERRLGVHKHAFPQKLTSRH
jgi:hypothetical protein